MNPTLDLAEVSREELVELVGQLLSLNRALEARVAELPSWKANTSRQPLR